MSEPSTTITPSTPLPTSSLWLALLVAFCFQFLPTGQVQAADELREVAVADPYLEMHTGPGRGYPIFHVVDRGENVSIVMQRTDWYFIRAENGTEGWVEHSAFDLPEHPVACAA